MDTLLRETLAAQSIQQQAQAYRERIQTRLAEREQSLLDEEQELVALRDELDADAFSDRVSAFEERAESVRRERSEHSARLQKALNEATEELRSRLRPVIEEIASERRAGVVIDERDVVLNARALNVTLEVINRFNQRAPVIEVRLPAAADAD